MFIEQIDADEVIGPRPVDAKVRQGHKATVLIGCDITIVIGLICRKNK